MELLYNLPDLIFLGQKRTYIQKHLLRNWNVILNVSQVSQIPPLTLMPSHTVFKEVFEISCHNGTVKHARRWAPLQQN